MFEFTETAIPGVLQVRPRKFTDTRGDFFKIFHENLFAERGIHAVFREVFYSHSHQNVLRGMHFQLPPHDHAKLVCCVAGRILDVVVDLRVGSPTYLQSIAVELSSESADQLYVPSGLAHGFYTLSPQATVLYQVTSVHAPKEDAGIHWNSFGFDWPGKSPIVSVRDSGHPALSEFKSPFQFSGAPA